MQMKRISGFGTRADFIASAIYRAFKEYKQNVEKAGYVQELAKVNDRLLNKKLKNLN